MPKNKKTRHILPREEWPYDVPKNWIWVTVDALKKDDNGFFDGDWILSENMDPDGNVRLLQLSDIGIGEFLDKSDKHISEETYHALGCTQLCEGDVMISRMSEPIARSCVVPFFPYPVITAVDVAILRCNSNLIVNYYLNYLCNTNWFTNLALRLARGTTRMRITRRNLGQMPVPLPPLFEQQRIVARIESFFAKLDAAEGRIKDALEKSERLLASVLNLAFTGELTEKWRCANCVTMENWDLLTLNDVADYKKGPFGSSITKAMFVPKGDNTYKVYEQGNAIRKTLDYGRYYINEKKYNELKGFAIQAGDIIISCAGTIGEVYKLPEDCEAGVINQALMRVRLYPNIEEQFFVYYFGEVIKGDVINKSKGTAIQNIPPFKVMKAIAIHLPPIHEQREIVHILDAVFDSQKRAKKIAEESLSRIARMRKSLLSLAFRGQLGTNDPTEESMESVLLASS